MERRQIISYLTFTRHSVTSTGYSDLSNIEKMALFKLPLSVMKIFITEYQMAQEIR